MNENRVFPDSALHTIAAAAKASAVQLELVLHPGEGDSELAQRLDRVAREITERTKGLVQLSRGDGTGPPALPALTIAAGQRRDIHYLAVPEEAEAAPFLDTLHALASGTSSHRSTQLVADLRQPAELMVLVAPGCPNCPHAVAAACSLVVASPMLTLSVVDVTTFASMAESFGVRSVPTTVIDRELTIVGVVPAQQLVKQILSRGTEEHQHRVLESMLDSGRFSEAAGRLAAGRGAPHFVTLWRSSTLERRISLMLTAEQILEHEPSALDQLAADLLPALEATDQGLRGDTVDLLGAIGHRVAQTALETLLEDPDPDLAEAASDALAAIVRRQDSHS